MMQRFAMQPAGAFLQRLQLEGDDRQREESDELQSDEQLRDLQAVGEGSSFEQELLALAKLQLVAGPLTPAAPQPSDAGAAFLESIRRGLEQLSTAAEEDEEEDEEDEEEEDDEDEGYYKSTAGNTYYYVPGDKPAPSVASLDLSNTSTASASSGSFASAQPCAALARRSDEELMFELEM